MKDFLLPLVHKIWCEYKRNAYIERETKNFANIQSIYKEFSFDCCKILAENFMEMFFFPRFELDFFCEFYKNDQGIFIYSKFLLDLLHYNHKVIEMLHLTNPNSIY